MQGTILSKFTNLKPAFDKLLKYLTPEKYAVVGGIVISYFFESSRVSGHKELNDIDIILEEVEYIDPTITNEFRVWHYHQPNKNKFYVAALYEPTKTKIDLFSWDQHPLKFDQVIYDEMILKVPTVENQFAKTLLDVYQITKGSNVNKKQVDDLPILKSICTSVVDIQSQWEHIRASDDEINSLNAYSATIEAIKKHPELVGRISSKPLECSQCIPTGPFKLTPLKDIYRTMGTN